MSSNTMKYLENKYKCYEGVPFDFIEEELLQKVKPPSNAIIKLRGEKRYPVKYVSFEWIANTIELLNS